MQMLWAEKVAGVLKSFYKPDSPCIQTSKVPTIPHIAQLLHPEEQSRGWKSSSADNVVLKVAQSEAQQD